MNPAAPQLGAYRCFQTVGCSNRQGRKDNYNLHSTRVMVHVDPDQYRFTAADAGLQPQSAVCA